MNEKKDTSQILDQLITGGEDILSSAKRIIESGEVIIQALKDLKEVFTVKDAAALPEPPKPDESPKSDRPSKEYTFEEVRSIMADLAGRGKKAEAKALLKKYGANRLSDLDNKNYTSLAEEAKVITNG